MKYVVILCALISFGLLFTGLYLDFQGDPLKHKMYGLGTMGLFLVTFPVFLIWRRKKITMDKYMWKNPNEKIEDQKNRIDKSQRNS